MGNQSLGINISDQITGTKSKLNHSYSAGLQKDAEQQLSNRSSAAPSLKKRQKRSESDCILDVEHSPIPEFPSNEVVIGVITMEDVIEELLQVGLRDIGFWKYFTRN